MRTPTEQPALTGVRPVRRESALMYLVSHATPFWDNCSFLCDPARIFAATKLCLAITLSLSITSAEHTASLTAVSRPLQPAPSSVLLPHPSLLLSLSTFGRWLVARPLLPSLALEYVECHRHLGLAQGSERSKALDHCCHVRHERRQHLFGCFLRLGREGSTNAFFLPHACTVLPDRALVLVS